jgi:hypothetical protein
MGRLLLNDLAFCFPILEFECAGEAELSGLELSQFDETIGEKGDGPHGPPKVDAYTSIQILMSQGTIRGGGNTTTLQTDCFAMQVGCKIKICCSPVSLN